MKLIDLKPADIALFKDVAEIGYDNMTHEDRVRIEKVSNALANSGVDASDCRDYVDQYQMEESA